MLLKEKKYFVGLILKVVCIDEFIINSNTIIEIYTDINECDVFYDICNSEWKIKFKILTQSVNAPWALLAV